MHMHFPMSVPMRMQQTMTTTMKHHQHRHRSMKAAGIGVRSLPTILLASMRLLSLLPSYASALSYSTEGNSFGEASSYSTSHSYRTVQVQVVHRHGDRTPITPLKNEEYWKNQLVPEDLLERVATGTKVLRNNNGSNNSSDNDNKGKNHLEIHAAAGKGPFGKLTKLGLLGMIQVGTTLKEELEESTKWAESTNAASSTIAITTQQQQQQQQQQHRKIKLTPKDIKVYSTDFDRTIQSVQGLLVGFFPDDGEKTVVSIDCRDTTCWMIPDPQPRQTHEQKVLERTLARRPHVLQQEELLRPLAVRCTDALLPLLGDGAFGVSFGVDENDDDQAVHKKQKGALPPSSVLSWIQLTEITTCLRTRGMLPDTITEDDQEALSAHTAWKWFQSLRSPRLANISMGRFAQTLVRTMEQRDQEPPLIVYSGHDSSLIGLLCALHLEQPSVWPEYGAVFKLELLEKRKEQQDGDDNVEHVLRFFLNGQLLRSVWNDTPREEISLQDFIHLTSTVGNDATAEMT
mmetsp:Transcript_26220/g.57423  ORF Transcript_26220/g.57423 Transcript_26220/m.57423 type:complete len:516 (-) Transcript_26220:200-1747(-)